MEYSVQNLTQLADCNALLTWAAREKADLDYKKTTEERMTVRYATTAQELDAILQGVMAELAATETIIAVLPDGPTKEDALKRKVRLEYKIFLLETRRESYGTVALLEKEMDLGRVNQEIEEVNAFIAAIEAQMATLPVG